MKVLWILSGRRNKEKTLMTTMMIIKLHLQSHQSCLHGSSPVRPAPQGPEQLSEKGKVKKSPEPLSPRLSNSQERIGDNYSLSPLHRSNMDEGKDESTSSSQYPLPKEETEKRGQVGASVQYAHI